MFLSRSLCFNRPRTLKVIAQITTYAVQAKPSKNAEVWEPFFSPRKPSLEGKLNDFGNYDAFHIAMQKKRKIGPLRTDKKRKLVPDSAHASVEGSNEEVLEIEVLELLEKARNKSNIGESTENTAVIDGQSSPVREGRPVEQWKEYEVDVVQISSTGDGLAYSPEQDHVIVVPFTVPGDRVLAKIYRVLSDYSHADLVKLIKPSALREGVTPQCKYFAECGGCQLQMIPYEEQLKHKKTIVEKAFKHFSGLPAHKVPAVKDTMGSPLQYGYRTKLSPHFNLPRRPKEGRNKPDQVTERDTNFNIGFNRKGRQQVMDIEQCPIGTDIVNVGMTIERARAIKNINKFKRGATLLLRETTSRRPNKTPTENGSDRTELSQCDFDAEPISSELKERTDANPIIEVTYPTYTDQKSYTSDMSGMSTEYIEAYQFVNRAGSFFQNNNSILRPFTSYIRDQVNPQFEPESKTKTTVNSHSNTTDIKFLLDAYCGSGLFTITLSPIFASALGIDCDPRGIEAARLNAKANNIPNAGFIDADASSLFADVPYPPDNSLVVMDPPRRGASEDFLRQLCMFRARRVIYVSCNVHSQARDIGFLVRGFSDLKGSCRYEIESLKGFDFFPQTGHVEGVCVLNRVDMDQ